ncbi:hypothetical protein CLU83_2591 [Flavobacterium sp. 1]|nr:hypothetical protein CLU83_2591 [Flavobacterium sp. 1]
MVQTNAVKTYFLFILLDTSSLKTECLANCYYKYEVIPLALAQIASLVCSENPFCEKSIFYKKIETNSWK